MRMDDDRRAIEDLDRRLANVIRLGRVIELDAARAEAVVDFGDFTSPPLSVGQLSAGALQFWWMPSIGEQVLVCCEGGDIAQGTIVASLYAGNAPSTDASVPQINLAGGPMIINGAVSITGNLTVGDEITGAAGITAQGNITAEGDVVGAGISLSGHTHSETGTKTGGPQ